jgi:Ion channel
MSGSGDSTEVVDLQDDLAERSRLSWQDRLSGPDRYAALLILIVVAIVASVVLNEREWERLVSLGLVGVMLVFALRTSQAPVAWQAAALVAVPLIVAATAIATTSNDGPTIRAAVAGTVTVLLIAVQVAIVRRLSTHLTISWNTIMGALCVYLLFGMIFAGAYAVAGHLEDGRLFAEQDDFTSTDALYFSLTTLTTVGFGDLTMRADATRIAAAMEALLGQIYLITAVALLVGNLGQQRRGRRTHAGKPSRRGG